MQTVFDHGRRSAHRMAIDPVVDFPIDYWLLSELVHVLANDMAALYKSSRPVAVQLDHGLARALLDLALITTGIPQLPLPSSFGGGDTAAAIAWSGAQAAYLSSTARIVLRHCLPIAPLPELTARIAFAPREKGNFAQLRLSLPALVDVVESQVRCSDLCNFDRHLSLLPPWTLTEAVAGFYATIMAGGIYVVPPGCIIGLDNPRRPNFAQLLKALADLRITSLVLNLEQLTGMVSALEGHGGRLPLLKRVVLDGAVPEPLLDRSRAVNLPVTVIAESEWPLEGYSRPTLARW